MDAKTDDTAELMARVGARVRRAREVKGIPRRVLSDLSGVSPRYLAQLESGEGNISIALLARVARALDHRIEWMLSVEDPATSDALRMAELYRLAEPAVQAKVRTLLAPAPAADRAQRICLIGLRGAGKSTLGRRAAERLGLPFVELNKEIEVLGQMPVAEIIALYGPEGYRQFEADALEQVIARHDRLMLAVAGGIVNDADVYETLLNRCHTIWLRAEPQDHMDRVRAQGDLRPMQGQPQAMAQLRAILAAREGAYARATAQVDTSGLTVEAALAALLDLVARHGFLD